MKRDNQLLLLLRGLPGAGKSTYARTLTEYTHLETDMYFSKDGEYNWDGSLLGKAHKWCQDEVRRVLISGSNVVVSNTFTKKWEMEAYFEMAKELNIPIKVIEMTGSYPNIHGVSEEHIAKMKARWEKL